MTGSPADRADDLALALHAAREAGRAIMRAFRVEQEVRFKGPEQPVTEADLAADRLLHRLLRGERPEYGWLSEETADSPDRLSRERLWVVDPLDGTSSFVAGRPEFAVSVGLVERGIAVLGVVHNPVTGETYHAAAGGGAFKDGVPVRVSTEAPEGPPRLLASRSDLRRGALVAFADGWRVEPLGSTAYKLARVAEGAAEGFAAFGPRAEWDVCAAAVLVAEAGGSVTRLDGGGLRFNQPNPSWRGVAGSNGRVHPELLRVLAGA